jgi:hypothetical protein
MIGKIKQRRKITMENEISNSKERVSTHRRHHKKIGRIIGAVIGGVIMAVVFAFVFGIVVKVLWNWLMPGIFGLPIITYWQAFGIVILTKMLFGGFGHHHNGHHPPDHFHKKIDQKWHRFIGVDDEDDNDEWAPGGSHKNWKYYKQYWKDEGKAAFEAYIERIESEKKER